MDADTILKRYEIAKEARARLEPLFDDAMRLTMPGRRRFNDPSGPVIADDIFDETGANSTTEFTSRIQGGIAPTFTEFVKLDSGDDIDPRDRKAVNRDLDEINDFMFGEIWDSNFAQELSESLLDMSISTGMMLFEEGEGQTSFHHRAIPITDFLIERGAGGAIGGVFTTRTLKAEQIPVEYPAISEKTAPSAARMITHEADKELTIIEYARETRGPWQDRFSHTVLIEETKEIISERKHEGLGSNPFIGFRFNTNPGDAWGRGPLLNAMGAIRTTNLMVEMVLENAAMSIMGIYQTDNDGTMNVDNISLLPGTVIAREIGTRGLEQVNGATGNFNMQDVVLGDQRNNIKRALFNDTLSDPNKTPATATEVAERMADLAHRTASPFSRLFFEFIQPYIRRALYILVKQKKIELPVVNGRAIRIRAVSPIAQAQHGRDVQQLVQDFQIRASMFGPNATAAMYDLKELHPWLQKRMGLETKLFSSVEEVVKAMEEQAQMAAQMQQMQQGGGA